MAKALVEVDEDLLAEAAMALGTDSDKDTVSQALRFAVDKTRARRERALADLQRIAGGGEFTFDRLDELDR